MSPGENCTLGTCVLNSSNNTTVFPVTQCNKQGFFFTVFFYLSHLTKPREPLITQKETRKKKTQYSLKYSKAKTFQLEENQVKEEYQGALVPVPFLSKPFKGAGKTAAEY